MTKAMEQTESLMAVQEMMGQISDAVQGYRAKLEEAGFSPTASEVMAIDFHKGLINMIFTNQTKGET